MAAVPVSEATLREVESAIDRSIVCDQLINHLVDKNIITADDVNRITKYEDIQRLEELIIVLLEKGDQFHRLGHKILMTASTLSATPVENAIETGAVPRVMTSMYLSNDWPLKNFLIEFCEKIGRDDFRKMKHLMHGEHGFKTAVMETDIDGPMALFDRLRETRLVNAYNLLFLQALVRRIERMDLVEEVRDFCMENDKKPIYFVIPEEKPEPGCKYVKYHVKGNLDTLARTELETYRHHVSAVLCVPLECVMIVGIEPRQSLLFTFMVPKDDVKYFINSFSSKRDSILAMHPHLSIEVTSDCVLISETTVPQVKDESAVLRHLGNMLQREQNLEQKFDDQDAELSWYKTNFADTSELKTMATFYQHLSNRLIDVIKEMRPMARNTEDQFSRDSLIRKEPMAFQAQIPLETKSKLETMEFESQLPSNEIVVTSDWKELPFCIHVNRSFYDLAVKKKDKTADDGPDQHVIDLQWVDTEEDKAFTTEWKLKMDYALKPEQWTKIHEKISSFGFKLFQDSVVRKLYDFKACLTAVKGWDLQFTINHGTRSQLKMALIQKGAIAAVFKDFFFDILGNIEFEVNSSDKLDSGFSLVPVDFFQRCKSILARLDGMDGLDDGNVFTNSENRLSIIETRMLDPTSLTVAVHGVTGVGKSSLLNALLDTSSLMPTSAMGKSVTSVAIMVEANENNDKYEADVEFISEEEWEAEQECLQTDIEEEDEEPDNISDVIKAAKDRLTAVYGRQNWKKHLEKKHLEKYDSELLKKLNTTETLKGEDPQALGEALTTYARNTEDEFQYWPLVKRIVIRVPNRSLCDSGCILVDLPGIGDTNSAREEVGKKYIMNCDLMLIVANISRVIIDKTVANALDENLLRDLRMDQRKAIVVCSHSDLMETKLQSEIIRKFDLKEAHQLGEEIKSLNTKRQELMKQKNRDVCEQVEIDNDIKEKKGRKMSLCVQARNAYIKKDLQEKLTSELHVPYGKQVDVFCISSTEYLKYKMQDSDLIDDEGMKFSSEEDTEIPQLRDYLRSAAKRKREEAAKKCQEEFRDLVSDLKTYATNSFHPEELEILASEGPKTMSTVWGNLTTNVEERIKDFMETQLRELYKKIGDARSDAVLFTRSLRQKWEKEYSHKTYQAIVADHRQGVYSSGRLGQIDLNEQLSEPFFDRIEEMWTEGFACQAWDEKLTQEMIQPAERAIDDWGDKMKTVLRRTSCDEDNINIDEMCENLKRKLKIEDIVTLARDTARDIRNTRSNKMQSLMKSTYKKVSGESKGKGALKKMHKKMEEELNGRCTELYDKTADLLQTELDKFQKDVMLLVATKLEEIQTDLESQMKPIREQKVILEVQSNITEINELLADCKRLVATQNSQTGKKRTAASRTASGPDGDIVDSIPSTSLETPRPPKRIKQSKH